MDDIEGSFESRESSEKLRDIAEEVDDDAEVSSDVNLLNSIQPSTGRCGRYPFCVVWTPIPILTWLCPPIGHVGICNSEGIVCDFSGPYTITKDNMLFGNPTRYIYLKDHNKMENLSWDRSVEHGNKKYKKKMHNIICQNCHHHVCEVLNHMNYRGRRNYDCVSLALRIFFKGKYVSSTSCIKTFLPSCLCYILLFVILLPIVVILGIFAKDF